MMVSIVRCAGDGEATHVCVDGGAISEAVGAEDGAEGPLARTATRGSAAVVLAWCGGVGGLGRVAGPRGPRRNVKGMCYVVGARWRIAVNRWRLWGERRAQYKTRLEACGSSEGLGL